MDPYVTMPAARCEVQKPRTLVDKLWRPKRALPPVQFCRSSAKR